LCGEIGGKPLEALALIAIGYRGLSMAPANIGPVKAMVLELDAADARTHLAGLMADKSDAPSLRNELQAYAEAKGVPL
jgi:phosphotransferase system, enzyme I, PtsP